MSIKELRHSGKPLLFTKSTTYGALLACVLRNLEMKDGGVKYARTVNMIYILTYAGIPSSPAAARAPLLRAAKDACQQCCGKYTDCRRQDPAISIPEGCQPHQKADGKAAPCNRKRGRQPLPSRMLRSQKAPEKNCNKTDAAGCRRDLFLIDHTAEHKPRPKR